MRVHRSERDGFAPETLRHIVRMLLDTPGADGKVLLLRYIQHLYHSAYLARLAKDNAARNRRYLPGKLARIEAVREAKREAAKAPEKRCTKCQQTKPIDEFAIARARSHDGRDTRCYTCKAELRRAYADKHPEVLKRVRITYVSNNIDKCRERNRQWRVKNKSQINERAFVRRWSNPEERIAISLRSRLRDALGKNGVKKSVSSLKLVGCSTEYLRSYLSSLFKEGMNWENYGYRGWHIDHIRPCASFDLTDITQQQECFHYTNLQPLWWWENLSKGARLPTGKENSATQPSATPRAVVHNERVGDGT